MTDHEYYVNVGNIRAKDPQGIRDGAIDQALSDVPDADARYEVMPGYRIHACENPDGKGALMGIAMKVRITVAAVRASWTAPEDPALIEAVRKGDQR